MNKIIHGDSLEVLKSIESESVDLLCSDPPYAISFMGKSWDKTLPDIGIFKECFRVLKPGSFAFVMSAPRSDVCARMMLMLEDAGFEIGFTPIYWTYASGFPKAMNIGKMVDKRAGVERTEVLGKRTRNVKPYDDSEGWNANNTRGEYEYKAPATDAAKALDGSYGGFQPKPAVEVVIVAMKPLSEKTYVDQALKNGKGITWLDDARIPANGEQHRPFQPTNNDRAVYGEQTGFQPTNADGRFPANLLVSDDVLNDHSRFFSLDEWTNTLPFLTVPKAAKSEKNAGLDDFPDHVGDTTILNGICANCHKVWIDGKRKGPCCNSPKRTTEVKKVAKNVHPTVKPLKLMSYLITLASRPGDVVLDPFLGSGTTALAAKQLGRDYIGIEREEEYVEIARARIQAIEPTLL